MNEPFSPIKDEQLDARAISTIKDTFEIPKNFHERSDGLVVPERLRNPEPEITICGQVGVEMFKRTSEDLQKIAQGDQMINGLSVNFSSFGGGVTPGFGVHDL